MMRDVSRWRLVDTEGIQTHPVNIVRVRRSPPCVTFDFDIPRVPNVEVSRLHLALRTPEAE